MYARIKNSSYDNLTNSFTILEMHGCDILISITNINCNPDYS